MSHGSGTSGVAWPLVGLVLVALLSAPVSLFAQVAPPTPPVGTQPDGFVRRWFETRPWYEPLVADPRGAHVSLIALARSRAFPFMVKEGSRRVWEIHLGREVPFVLREKGSSGDGPIAPGGWGFGVWFPVSVHFVEDFKDDGHPIVNTDYRVGASFKLAHGLSRFPRDRVFVQLQVGHESGHVGDEFLLNAQAAAGPVFERVDVTYQFLDGGVSWITPSARAAPGNSRYDSVPHRRSPTKAETVSTCRCCQTAH